MDPTTLLDEVEGLTHTARTARMVALGRDAGARGAIAELASHPQAYARSLAVASIHGSRDVSLLLCLVVDRSRVVRRRAQRLVPLVCDDADAERALAVVPSPRERQRLALRLRIAGRLGPVDAFLRAAKLDARALDALPFASEGVVTTRMPELHAGESATSWIRLAKNHPKVLVRMLLAQVERLATDARTRSRLPMIARHLAESDPAGARELFDALLARGELPSSPLVHGMLRPLLRAYPCEVFDAIRARHARGPDTKPPGAFASVRLDKVAHRLGPERLAWTVQHAWATLSDGPRARRWFLRMSVADRAALVDAWLAHGGGGWGAFLLRHVPLARRERREAYLRWSAQAQDVHGVVPITKIDALPADLRAVEGRRLLDLGKLVANPALRLPYASLLPFDEAIEAVAPFLGHPEGEVRALAVHAVISSVVHDRAAMPKALAAIRARKFEQDPVRLSMLRALVALPRTCFRREHLDDLAAIVADALDASDLSPITASVLEELPLRIFPLDPDWAARTIAAIVAKRGMFTELEDLTQHILPRDAEKLDETLAPLVAAWRKRESTWPLVFLARNLGLRLGRVKVVLDAIEELARDESPVMPTVEAAIELLEKRAPLRFREVVPDVLAKDKSLIGIPCVARFVATSRQDLLAPFLTAAPMEGRMATGRTGWVVDFGRGYGRWTARQSLAHAESWMRLLADPERDVPALLLAVDRLVALPFAPEDVVLPYANDARPPVRERAVRTLGRLDAGAGVDVLLACLDDARARWAIYALRTALGEMAEERAVEVLLSAPLVKVTVAKEVARLLGDLGGDRAYAELVALERRPGLHRDVRIAALRGLWAHLDREPTWEVFDRAVADPDWVVATKLANVPVGRLTDATDERVAALLARILDRPEPFARVDMLQRVGTLALADTSRRLFDAVLGCTSSRYVDEARLAAQGTVWRMRAGDVERVVAALDQARSRRRLFASTVAPMFAPHAYSPEHIRVVAARVLAWLEADPLATPVAIGFAASVRTSAELADTFATLAAADRLDADAMQAAYGAVAKTPHPARIDAALASAGDPRLRRIALEALRVASQPSKGWTEERRARLASYRADPSPLVAGAAAYVAVPGEDDANTKDTRPEPKNKKKR